MRGKSRIDKKRLFAIVLALSVIFVALAPNALAVHDLGVFQLDKNAETGVQSSPAAAEDWDLICKALPSQCTFSGATNVPTGTTVAAPKSFEVDPSESSTDDILKGGTKDDNAMSSWKWASAKPSPPKNDITHAFAAEYKCKGTESNSVAGCTGNAGDTLLYFGADRFSNSGSANIAFWFFHRKVQQLKADGTPVGPTDTCTISSGCTFSGSHKEGEVPHNPNNVGDLLIISAFGPKAQIQVYEWVGVGNASSPCFTNACSLVPLIPASSGQACEDVTLDNACATVNDVSTPSPWTLQQKNAPANAFAPTNFFEGGLNLTQLRVDGCFSSFLVNTRASAAGDAELHDKILGQFGRCTPAMTTTASSTGTVQPGTSVTDTANITVTGATVAPDPTGDVTFFLCSNSSAVPDCSTGGTNIGTGTLVDGDPTDGDAHAVSPAVNTTTNQLANGFYCFRAEWPGDETYPEALSHTNQTTECFRVLRLLTTTVTDPQSPSGTNNTGPIALGSSVFDHAVVTGDAAGGSPTGSVSFFICNPTQVTGTAGSEVCPTSSGTAVSGNPVGVTTGPGANQSQATSGAVTANQLGVWCFRATFTPNTTIYTGSSDNSHRECFTVRTSSSATSQQKWLPNDRVVISTANGGSLTGTLSITLRSVSCTGAVVYTEPLANGGAITAPTTVDTTNSTFFVNTSNANTYYWRIVFTPDSPNADGFTECETSTVTVNDNP